MQMIQKREILLHDLIVNHLVTDVGTRILSHLPPQPFKYSFHVIDSDVFNAFASPAANIFIYRGVITSLDSIDELAGIIGHEIAHAASRHVSQSIDRSKFISIGSLAGILAGAIINSNSSREAGNAVIQGSMAAGQTVMLAFTRSNETEADEKGIMFLKKSCFSPEGLKTGLMKIRASDFQGVESIPDYVKTHPGTGKRIAHVENILSGVPPSSRKAACRKDFRFDMVKYRILGLYTDIEPAFSKLKIQVENEPLNPAVHYGIGLVYARKFMLEKALIHFRKALSINIFDPMILLDMGRVFILDGKPEKAVSLLEGTLSDPVIGIMAKFHMGEAHLEMDNFQSARRCFENVIQEKPSLFPRAYYNMAKIMSMTKEQALSHFYLGQYYSRMKKYKTAKLHFSKAIDTLDNPGMIKKSKELLKALDDLDKKI